MRYIDAYNVFIMYSASRYDRLSLTDRVKKILANPRRTLYYVRRSEDCRTMVTEYALTRNKDYNVNFRRFKLYAQIT